MTAAAPTTERVLTMTEALNEALIEEMASNDEVFVVGEDIAESGGLFQVTAGLRERFGAARSIDAPISEAAIVGMGIGAALVGQRPVVELQVFDFVTAAMDQLVNHAAKWRYMSGGQVSVPLVVRGPSCNGFGLAAQHSQSLESWFVHTPGLVVIMPTNAYDAKGLLKSAIRDPNPVVFIEKRGLYARSFPVPPEEYLVPIGVAEVKTVGDDVTVVATGQAVAASDQVARGLAREGIGIEVIDPRTLKPLDMETIRRSVAKTGRLVVVNEAAGPCGFAGEVVARVTESDFTLLRAAPRRVTAEDTPVPYAAALERHVLPSRHEIRRAVLETLGRSGD